MVLNNGCCIEVGNQQKLVLELSTRVIALKAEGTKKLFLELSTRIIALKAVLL
jgi:hypothetical protein